MKEGHGEERLLDCYQYQLTFQTSQGQAEAAGSSKQKTEASFMKGLHRGKGRNTWTNKAG